MSKNVLVIKGTDFSVNAIDKVVYNYFPSNINWVDGYYITAQGQVTENTFDTFSSSYSSIIDTLKANTTYTIKIKPSNRHGMTFARVHLYDDSGNWIKQLSVKDNSKQDVYLQFTTTSYTKIRLSVPYAPNSIFDYSYMKILKGAYDATNWGLSNLN